MHARCCLDYLTPFETLEPSAWATAVANGPPSSSAVVSQPAGQLGARDTRLTVKLVTGPARVVV